MTAPSTPLASIVAFATALFRSTTTTASGSLKDICLVGAFNFVIPKAVEPHHRNRDGVVLLTQQTTNGGAIPNLLMHGSQTNSSVASPLPENGSNSITGLPLLPTNSHRGTEPAAIARGRFQQDLVVALAGRRYPARAKPGQYGRVPPHDTPSSAHGSRIRPSAWQNNLEDDNILENRDSELHAGRCHLLSAKYLQSPAFD
jgi:hypothetical protein